MLLQLSEMVLGPGSCGGFCWGQGGGNGSVFNTVVNLIVTATRCKGEALTTDICSVKGGIDVVPLNNLSALVTQEHHVISQPHIAAIYTYGLPLQ